MSDHLDRFNSDNSKKLIKRIPFSNRCYYLKQYHIFRYFNSDLFFKHTEEFQTSHFSLPSDSCKIVDKTDSSTIVKPADTEYVEDKSEVETSCSKGLVTICYDHVTRSCDKPCNMCQYSVDKVNAIVARDRYILPADSKAKYTQTCAADSGSTPASDITIVACEGMESKDLSFVGTSKIWKIIV